MTEPMTAEQIAAARAALDAIGSLLDRYEAQRKAKPQFTISGYATPKVQEAVARYVRDLLEQDRRNGRL